MAMTIDELAKKKLANGTIPTIGSASSITPPGIAKNIGAQQLQQQESISEVTRQASQQPQLGISGPAERMNNQPSAPSEASKPIMINGVPHQNINATGGNPLAMMAGAYAEQAKMLMPSPFENRANARLEKNRAELGGEQQANTASPLGISANSNPPIDASTRSEHQRIMEGSPPAAGNAVSLRDQVKQGIQNGMQDNRAKFMADNKLSGFEDKGSGIVRGTEKNGGILITNVGTAEVTNPHKALQQANSIDLIGSNASLANANAIRQGMIDQMASANGASGAGYSSLGDGGIAASNAEKTKRWAIDDAASRVARSGGRSERAAASQMFNALVNSSTQERGQDINREIDMSRQGILARGQDINAKSDAERMALESQKIGIESPYRNAQTEGLQQANQRAAEMASIEKRALAGDQKAIDQLRSLKGSDDGRFMPVSRKVYGKDGLIIGEDIGAFDKRTGQSVGEQQKQTDTTQIPPADKREIGKTYSTPKGPMVWRGNGWEAA